MLTIIGRSARRQNACIKSILAELIVHGPLSVFSEYS